MFKTIDLKQQALRVFTIAFYVTLLLFLVLYLKNVDISVLKSTKIAWPFLVLSGFLSLSARFWQVFIWFNLLDRLGAKNLKASRFVLIFVYAKSWLGRYIPGTAPWILGKIFFASKHGISKKKLAVSSVLEGALQITVVMATALTMLLSDARTSVVDPRLKALVLCVLAICLLSIYPPIFNRLLSFLYKIIRKQNLEANHLVTHRTVLSGASLYIIGALLSGLSLFFISKAIYPELEYRNIFFVMGTSNLAGAISMLAVFAPSGLGVRESIQIVLLSLIMPTEYALLIAIVIRLWGITLDFTFLTLSYVLLKISRRRA